MRDKYCRPSVVRSNIKLKEKTVKRIIKKYDAFTTLKASKRAVVNNDYVLKLIPELQAITGDAAKIKAEDIISRVTYTRDNLIFKLKNVLKACQTDIEVKLTHLKAIGNFENVREAYMTLFGPSAHTKSSEPYFMKAAYYYFTNDMVVSCGKKPSIVCNKEGQTINILPLSATSKTSCPC